MANGRAGRASMPGGQGQYAGRAGPVCRAGRASMPGGQGQYAGRAGPVCRAGRASMPGGLGQYAAGLYASIHPSAEGGQGHYVAHCARVTRI